MGIFDGILLCSDLDDTLFTKEKRVSAENSRAIEYFKSEGGKFAFATGRAPLGARLAAEYVCPNAPIVCYNGAGIYDFDENKLLWHSSLGTEVLGVLDMVCEHMPQVGFEICTADNIYYTRDNRLTQHCREIQKYPENHAEFRDIKENFIKVVMMVEKEYIPELKNLIAESEYADSFTYVQSTACYYEILPKGTTKGVAMLELARMLGIDKSKTVAMGDNDNDYDMILRAAAGVAVANATRRVLEAADYITVDHENSAVSAVIEGLKKGTVRL